MFAKSLNPLSWSYPQAPYWLLVPVLLVSFLPGPVLLGGWESLTFYHTFGAVDAPLSFLIAPRANVGGQGYALLEMARAIIRDLHLPLNLFTFRMPSVFFGIVSLLLFFTICRRYFGPWPAIGATALLASNQVFFQYEHMMTVVVISGAALLFLIERLQALEFRYWDVKIWAGFALAMAFVSLHYGPARIFAVIFIGIWFAKAYWILKKIPGSNTMLHGIWTLAGYSAATFLILLAVLDYRNPISILRFSSFLFPKHSETMGFLGDEPGEGGLLKILGINLEILIDSILGRTGNYHSQYSSYLFADFRYPLLDRFTLPFVILGFIVAVISIKRRTVLFATPWANVLAMLAVFSLPLLSSSIVSKADGLVATLSVHRMYFILFPLHLLVAVFLHWLGTFSVNRVVKYGTALYLIAVFVSLIVNLIEEHSRFKNQVFASEWQRHGPEIKEIWDDRMPNLDRRDLSGFSHFQQHAQYANIAKKIADKLKMWDGGLAKMGARRIVFVDINKFSEAPISPAGLHYIANRNYHSIFLALYAGQEGVHLNPVILVDHGRRPISPNLMGGLAYRGRPREYSALMDLDKNGLLVYKKDVNFTPLIVELTGHSAYDVLVTTPEEEAGARSLLGKEKIPFDYVKF